MSLQTSTSALTTLDSNKIKVKKARRESCEIIICQLNDIINEIKLNISNNKYVKPDFTFEGIKLYYVKHDLEFMFHMGEIALSTALHQFFPKIFKYYPINTIFVRNMKNHQCGDVSYLFDTEDRKYIDELLSYLKTLYFENNKNKIFDVEKEILKTKTTKD